MEEHRWPYQNDDILTRGPTNAEPMTFLTAPNTVACPECGEAKLPHRLCGGCGTYKNRSVIRLEEDLA